MPNIKTIALIGSGHLGSALVRGLIKSGYPEKSIITSNRDSSKSTRLAKELGVLAAQTNTEAAENADIIVLAVKPQFMQDVCQELAATVHKKRPLIISLAGVTESDSITQWLGIKDLGVVRVMTNTPMEFRKGISALFANHYATSDQMQLGETLFNAVGTTFWVDKEPMLDTLTAAIGCSPAYVFLFMEALQKAAISRGIPEEFAAKIALATFSGSVALAEHSGRSFASLREGVTTPHGVTAYSLEELSTHTLFKTFEKVYADAEKRIAEIKRPRAKL